jgi:dienelactone hydrolase
MGGREVGDVRGALDYLERQGFAGRGVNLLGYSMGAATSLLAAAADSRVHAIAEDSGYADLPDILEAQVPRLTGLPPAFTPGTMLMCWALTGVNPYTVRPIDGVPVLAARRAPLLVIHGSADSWVPVAHGRRLAGAYGPAAQVYFVPGADHVGSYQRDPAGYLSRVTAFFAAAE